jgi:hypothetical protein
MPLNLLILLVWTPKRTAPSGVPTPISVGALNSVKEVFETDIWISNKEYRWLTFTSLIYPRGEIETFQLSNKDAFPSKFLSSGSVRSHVTSHNIKQQNMCQYRQYIYSTPSALHSTQISTNTPGCGHRHLHSAVFESTCMRVKVGGRCRGETVRQETLPRICLACRQLVTDAAQRVRARFPE